MNTLMMTLQQPLSVAALAQCLGFGAAKPNPTAARRRRRHHPHAAPAAATSGGLHGVPELQGEGDDGSGKGCGWFDSSRDLHQGLVVLEHSGVENLGAELPVTVWLALALDGTPAAHRVAPPAQLAVQA